MNDWQGTAGEAAYAHISPHTALHPHTALFAQMSVQLPPLPPARARSPWLPALIPVLPGSLPGFILKFPRQGQQAAQSNVIQPAH